MSELVLLSDLADEFGIDRSNARKYIIKHGFAFQNVRTSQSRGQLVLALTPEDADAVRILRQKQGFGAVASIENGHGWFYIICPDPELANNRVKLGFSVDAQQRLNTYLTICPSARIIKVWPCRLAWEKAAIASITREGCNQIGQEVFTCDSIDALVDRGDAFFSLMPEG